MDTESDGQPTLDADGDNILGLNDEDGVSKPLYESLVPGSTVEIKATVSTNGDVNADLGLWIDWDGDGSFELTSTLWTMSAQENKYLYGQRAQWLCARRARLLSRACVRCRLQPNYR